jgi:hypothetical protein
MHLRKIMIFSLFSCLQLPAQEMTLFDGSQRLLMLNPSFAGSNGYVRNQFGYYRQTQTNSFGFYNGTDGYASPLKAGISAAAMYYNQNGGKFNTTGGSLGYAQYMNFHELLIIPSVNIVSYTRMMDTSKFSAGFFRSIDLPDPVQKIVTGSAGILLNFKDLYIGMSAIRVGRSEMYIIPPVPILNLHMSYNLFMGENCRLNIQLRYQEYSNGDNIASGINALLFRNIVAGAFYNTDQESYFTLGYNGDMFVLTSGWHTFKGINEFDLSLGLHLRKHKSELEKINSEAW